MHLLNRLMQQVQTLQVDRWHDLEGTGQHSRDLDPKVKLKCKTTGICDGVSSTAALVFIVFVLYYEKTDIFQEFLFSYFFFNSSK